MSGERITVLLLAGENEAQNAALLAAFEAQTARAKLTPLLAVNGQNSPVFDEYAALHGVTVLSGTLAAVFNAAKAVAEGDYLAVGEGCKDAYLYLAAKERPDGSREVFVSGIDITSDRIESVTLRNNLINWLKNSLK